MRIIRTKAELKAHVRELKRSGKTIGLVPTMGFLHEGHLSLIDIARGKADAVIVSVFVNPTQFAPNEDFDSYPRDFDRDAALCAEHGANAVFAPEPEEMYDPSASTWVEEVSLSKPLCGASRPTFFRGVTTVVSKLFHLAQPDIAVFGQKDAQQLLVVSRMVRDLDFPIEIIAAPLVRGQDGLALSSRNRYLTPDEHLRATNLHRSLVEARAKIEAARAVKSEFIEAAKEVITAAGGKVDYVSALDRTTLREPTAGTTQILLAAAAWFGTTRLIDNELIDF